MIDISTISPYISMAILGLVAVLALIGALKGRSRGFAIQLVRTITVVASAAIALFVTQFAYSILIAQSSTYITTAESLLGTVGISLEPLTKVASMVGSTTPNPVHVILISLIILPIVFVVSFMLISFVMLIVHVILCKIFHLSKWNNNFFTRLLGMLLGAVQGALVAIICIGPFCGFLGAFSTGMADVSDSSSLKQTYNQSIKAVAEDPYVTMIGSFGGTLLYDQITTVTVNDQKYTMSKEVIGPALKLADAAPTIASMSWQNMTKSEKDALNSIIAVADGSAYMQSIIADVLDNTAKTYKDNMPKNPTDADEFVESVLDVFTGIQDKEVVPTLTVIKNVLFMLSEEYDIEVGDDTVTTTPLRALNTDAEFFHSILKQDKDLINNVKEELKKSEKTEALVQTFTELSVNIMAEQLKLSADIEISEDTYENVKTGIQDISNVNNSFKNADADDPEYLEAVANAIGDTFEESGFAVEKSVLDEMAVYVAENYKDRTDEISDEEANDIILSYYSVYMETVE